MGRMLPNPRYEVVSFRATKDEVDAIDAAARLSGKDRSVFVRELVGATLAQDAGMDQAGVAG